MPTAEPPPDDFGPRSPDHHPGERSTRSKNHHPHEREGDRGRWAFVVAHKLWRDVWLFIITALVVLSLINIQNSRRDALYDSCQASNERHDNTVKELDETLAQIPPGPQKDQAEATRKFTVSLIDTLSPKRDCEQVVNETLGQKFHLF